MHKLVKRIHMYLGLLGCSAVLVYAVAGLHATTYVRPADRPRPPVEAREIAFAVPATATDAEAGRLVWEKIGRPMTSPPPNVRRDGDRNIFFNVFEPNGMSRVTYVEKDARIRVERARIGWAQFFMNLHETTPRNPSADLRMKLWKYYNEFAIWCLLAMVLTGWYLWLASRPRLLWAHGAFWAGTLGVVALLCMR